MPRPRKEHGANARGKIRGISVPFGKFCCAFVRFGGVWSHGAKREKHPLYRCFWRSSASAYFAQRMRVERMAWPDVLVEGIGVLYLKFAPPDRPLVRKGVHNPWSHRLRPTGLQAIY